jgi:hypothetical protein
MRDDARIAFVGFAFVGLGEANLASEAEYLQTSVQEERQEARRCSNSRYPESSEPGYPRAWSLVASLVLGSR